MTTEVFNLANQSGWKESDATALGVAINDIDLLSRRRNDDGEHRGPTGQDCFSLPDIIPLNVGRAARQGWLAVEDLPAGVTKISAGSKVRTIGKMMFKQYRNATGDGITIRAEGLEVVALEEVLDLG